ncbi:MAG: hypothetical protein JWM77_3637 [Rhodospirillales bacterium]|nr:hypothetical protein [Rhodospirillales bacterium]
MTIYVGLSGWTYAGWRGVFYPPKLPHKRELAYAAAHVNSIEINGTFYSLQRPSSFERWRDETPDDFLFALKGPRFLTHMKKLTGVEEALANFFASGVLALNHKLGPILWQLPPVLRFDADRMARFFSQLPRDTAQALNLARHHGPRLVGRSHLAIDRVRPMRHALEPRHDSFAEPESLALMRRYNIALVAADSSRWSRYESRTADFAYARLHGGEETYVSGYDDAQLRDWAGWVRREARGGRDVFVYFDNDAKVRAPADAIALAKLLKIRRQPGSICASGAPSIT